MAQNEVAIGSSTTKSNAILWLNGNGSQGLILPVVTNKSAVSNPDRGMIVYDDSDNKVWYRNNNTWVEVAGGSGSTANLNLAIQGNQLLLRDGPGILSAVNIAGGTQTTGAFLVFQGGSWQFATLSGDVTGANAALQVTGLRGKPVATLPATAQMLVYDPAANSNNGGWVFQPFVAAVGITSVSGTAPVTVTNPTTTPNISLANAGITNALLADNAVTSAKIQDGTITGADIAGTTITADRLAQSGAAAGQVLKWNGTNWAPQADDTGSGSLPVLTPGQLITNNGATNVAVNMSGDATFAGTGALTIGNNAITSAKIADGTITGADIAALTITSANIVSSSITADKLAQSGASAGQVLKWNGSNWAPQADDTGSGSLPALTSGQLVTNNGATNVAVTMSGDATFSGTGALTIGNNAITSAKIADGTITGTDIANNSITADKLSQSGATPNQVLQWNGSNWIPASVAAGTGWSLTGNAGTDPATNFIGTTDAQALNLRTNSTDRMTISSTGNVGIGAANPAYQLTLGSTGTTLGVENNAQFFAKNATGTYQLFFIPRFTDNVMYMNYGTGGFNIRNSANVSAVFMAGNGNVGIGNTTPNAQLQLATNTALRKLVLYDVNNNDHQFYGFGVVSGQIRYQTQSTVSNHVFYAGTSATTSAELMRITGGGNVIIAGSLTKGSGTFKIDHPLDPENKFLYHSFVESPDMMNIYNGNITTNNEGAAIIHLPDYFESLNKDFRYQLTVIGEFAQAIVARKVQNNTFAIKTDKPNVEVSWQVTGIRKDPYAEQNRVIAEVEKSADEKGKYLHPEAYGLPSDRGIGSEGSNKL